MLRFLLALSLLALGTPHVALAQDAPAEGEAATPTDPFGRETPRGAITGLLDALAEQDYTRATNYMPATDGRNASVERAAQLARQLQAALDAGGSLDSFGLLSNEPGGKVDDGLPPEQEKVGSLSKKDGTPILLLREEVEEGPAVWRISPETVRELQKEAPELPADEGEEEKSLVVAGAPLQDWAILLTFAIGSFLLFWVISLGILAVMHKVWGNREASVVLRISEAALPPLALFIAVVGFQLWAGSVEASIIARQTLLRYIGIVAWFALAWFAVRLVDAIAKLVTARMQKHERRQAVSIVLLIRRAAKIALLAIATVAILDTLGFDVTTGIAALGIGGLALALGAQKTVENLVGSVSVIADRPVQIGDFCRVGDVTGTVQDIGIRSTRIRTSERTVVTIPNSDFSSQQIENYSMRDRFLFNPTIGLEYGISAAKLREAVGIIENILLEHEKVDSQGARARFTNFGASSLDIDIYAYIMEADYAASLTVRQDLLLTIFEKLEAAGLSFAFPTQTLHLVKDEPTSAPNLLPAAQSTET